MLFATFEWYESDYQPGTVSQCGDSSILVRSRHFFEPATDVEPVRTDSWLRAGIIIAGVMTLVIALYPTPFFNLATASMAMLGGR